MTFQYDSLNRTTQKSTSSGDTYTYAYTGDGQLGRMTDSALGRTYGYTYDSLGRLVGYQENKTGDNSRILSSRYTFGGWRGPPDYEIRLLHPRGD